MGNGFDCSGNGGNHDPDREIYYKTDSTEPCRPIEIVR
jgi:hypothetical protein